MPFPAELMSLPAFDGNLDARKLQATGCDVLFASYRAGQSIDLHRHDTHNVGLVTQGQLRLEHGGVERRFGVGEWYRIERGTPHAAHFECDTSSIEFWFRDAPGTGPSRAARRHVFLDHLARVRRPSSSTMRSMPTRCGCRSSPSRPGRSSAVSASSAL